MQPNDARLGPQHKAMIPNADFDVEKLTIYGLRVNASEASLLASVMASAKKTLTERHVELQRDQTLTDGNPQE